jgi:hypothetical protein
MVSGTRLKFNVTSKIDSTHTYSWTKEISVAPILVAASSSQVTGSGANTSKITTRISSKIVSKNLT